MFDVGISSSFFQSLSEFLDALFELSNLLSLFSYGVILLAKHIK